MVSGGGESGKCGIGGDGGGKVMGTAAVVVVVVTVIRMMSVGVKEVPSAEGGGECKCEDDVRVKMI